MIAWMLAAAAAATGPAPLAPKGTWTVDYEESMCVLSHDFGEGGDRVTIGFRPWPMGEETELAVLWPDKGYGVFGGNAEVQLLPKGEKVSGSYSGYATIKMGKLATITVDQDKLGDLREASSVSVNLIHRKQWVVSLPPAAKAVAALKACSDDLLKSWGMDPDEQQHLSQGPKGNPAQYFGPDQYPPEAIRAGQQGRVVAIGTVGIDGRVTGCMVAVTSGSAILDQTTCTIMKSSMRYTPALDLSGKPIVSHTVLPVRWVLPED